MMETENLVDSISLACVKDKEWPEFSRYRPEKTVVSNCGARSPPGQNGSGKVQRLKLMSSSSGYETGSEKDTVVPDQSGQERRSSLTTVSKHSQPFLRVGGAAYPNHRRRSLSVNRYENPPDSPPPGGKGRYDDVTPRVIRPSSSLVNIGRTGHDDWSVSTSTRFYKFSPEGFNMARSAPIVHKPTLKIGLEGEREFSVSNSRHFPAYNVREISSARPGGRYRPSSVTTGRAVEGPLVSRTETREHFSRTESQASKDTTNTNTNSTTDSSSTNTPGPGSEALGPRWSRRPDPRFAGGSTTRATYRDVSLYTEGARQRPVLPEPSLKMEGDFSRDVSSKEHFKPLPYSRRPASVRRQMIQTPTGKFEGRTTYRDNIDEKTTYQGLRRSSRFDYSLRIPDKIDWL